MAIKKNWAELLIFKFDALKEMLKTLQEDLKYEKDKQQVQIMINNTQKGMKKIKNLAKRHRSTDGIIEY